LHRGKRILLRASTGFAIEVMTGGFYSVKLPNQAPYQLGHTRKYRYFVLSNVAPYCRFAALSGCKQKHASATPTKQLGHTRINNEVQEVF